MEDRKYYKCGLRPIIREIHSDYEEYFSFQWETGEFKQDMTYLHQVYYDPAGDIEELTKSEFDVYVKELKEGFGFETEE